MSTKSSRRSLPRVRDAGRVPPSGALSILVEDASAFRPVPSTRRIQHWITRAFATELSGELSVRIVNEAEGRDLNRRYRGRDAATNVLAFAGAEMPMNSAASMPRLLGDLVVCAPVVAREAAEQRTSLDAHWAHIALHGVLHLIGYDHEADEDARIMQRREAELLAKLGFDDPYDTGG